MASDHMKLTKQIVVIAVGAHMLSPYENKRRAFSKCTRSQYNHLSLTTTKQQINRILLHFIRYIFTIAIYLIYSQRN